MMKAYTYELPKYSTALAADNTIRYVNPMHKENVNVNVSSAFTLLVMPNTEVQYSHETSAPMYSGVDIMSEQQLFLLFYRRIVERLHGTAAD